MPYRLQIRFADTDAQGHVYFANYLTFFDEAMSDHLRSIGFPWQRLHALGVDLVFADVHATYRGRATFEEVLVITVEGVRLGNASMTTTLAAQKEDGTPVASAELVSVCVNRRTMKSTPLPAPLREALEVTARS